MNEQLQQQLEAKIRRQKDELLHQEGVIAAYKRKLDGLNNIWCTGGCYDNKNITETSIKNATTEYNRLIEYFFNREGRRLMNEEGMDYNEMCEEIRNWKLKLGV